MTFVVVLGGAVTANAAPFAYISNFNANTVSVLDTATDTVVDTVSIVSYPMGVAIPGDAPVAYLLTACSASPPCVGRVHVLDTSTNTVTNTIPVGTLGVSLALHPFDPLLYVVNNGSNDVSVVDTVTETVIATVPSLGVFPSGIAVEATGARVYVACSGGQVVSVIDTASNAVVNYIDIMDNPFAVATHPASNRAYVTHGCTGGADRVAVIDTATDTVIADVPVGGCPRGVAVNPAGTRVYVANWNSNNGNTVSVINTVTNTVVDTLTVGTGPWTVAVHPDGTKLYVVNNFEGSLTIVELGGGGGTANLPIGASTMARGGLMAAFVVPPGCGDGTVTFPEGCDDGNLVNGDGCDRNCTLTACGNGVVSEGEECDDRNLVDGDECTATCQGTACGDGRLTLGEECDDGNLIDGDTCSSSCEITACGDGEVTFGEQCEDGNTVAGDGCDASCHFEFIPGGGKVASDCFLEWMVDNPTTTPLFDKHGHHPRKQTCRDGDPACDGDGALNGSCTFRVRVCVNADDATLPTCTPTQLASADILRPSETQAAQAPDAAAVRAQLGVLASLITQPAGTCSGKIDMVVPLGLSGNGPRPGRRPLRTRVAATSGIRDSDALKLICLP